MGETDTFNYESHDEPQPEPTRKKGHGHHNHEPYHDPHTETPRRMGHSNASTPASRETTVTPQKPNQQPAPLDVRRSGNIPPNYQPNQHGDIPNVPHNEYPTDGMTMFCRTGPPSERSSAVSGNRPSSREDSHSDYSNPTSMSSVEPPSNKQSPSKPVNGAAMSGTTPEKQVQKKRSAFFSNSPFRRKSKHEKDRQSAASKNAAGNRNTWAAPPAQASPIKPNTYEKPRSFGAERPSGSPEPVDPRANFQLNVGNNVFDVASPDTRRAQKPNNKTAEEDVDPIAQALADLKGVGKNTSLRVSADRYHGISSPAPPNPPAGQAADRNVAAAQRGTPPPAYNDAPVKRLDAPQPAFTSAQMQKTTRRYAGQTQDLFNSPVRSSQSSTGVNQSVPRATSPAASRRSASPQPQPRANPSSSQYSNRGSQSPTPYQTSSINSGYRHSPSSSQTNLAREQSYSPQRFSRHNSPSEGPRGVSPRPQFRRKERPNSSNGMELQLSNNQVDYYGGSPTNGYGDQGTYGGGPDMHRPMSMYYGAANQPVGGQITRMRSKTVADVARQFSRDGRPILHFGE